SLDLRSAQTSGPPVPVRDDFVALRLITAAQPVKGETFQGGLSSLSSRLVSSIHDRVARRSGRNLQGLRTSDGRASSRGRMRTNPAKGLRQGYGESTGCAATFFEVDSAVSADPGTGAAIRPAAPRASRKPSNRNRATSRAAAACQWRVRCRGRSLLPRETRA